MDIARGIAIALIVLGHTQRGLVSSGLLGETAAVRFADAWLYAFHVPVFFVASGLFLPRAVSRGLVPFVTGRLRRLAYPYLLWAPLQHVIQSLASRYANNPQPLVDVWRVLYDPPMQFWFVYVLLLQSLLFGLLWAFGLRRLGGWLLLGALAHYAVVLGVPLGPWGPVYQASDNLIYLGLGIALGGPGLLQQLTRLGRAQALGIVGLGFVIMTPLVALVPGRYPVAAALAGIVGTFGLSQLTAGSRVGDALRLLGRRSLEIYVAHTIASAGVRILLLRGLGVTDPAVHMVAGTLVGVAGPLLLTALAQRYDFPYLFEWRARVRARAPS